MTATSLLILIIIEKLNKLVTALTGFAVTLELYFVLSILMNVYVVCDYTIPNKAFLLTSRCLPVLQCKAFMTSC